MHTEDKIEKKNIPYHIVDKTLNIQNKEIILKSIREKIGIGDEMHEFFRTSKVYRDSFANKKINGQANPTINVSIKDEKGSIATVATLLAENDINIKNIGIENNRENMNGALFIVFENYEEKEKGFEILQKNKYEVRNIK